MRRKRTRADRTPQPVHVRDDRYRWAEDEPDESDDRRTRESERRMLINTLAMFFQRGWPRT